MLCFSINFCKLEINSASASSFSKDWSIKNDDIYNYAIKNSIKLKEMLAQYSKNYADLTEENRENAFRNIYEEFLNENKKLNDYYSSKNYSLTDDYVKNYEEDYVILGSRFKESEGEVYFAPDYRILINTSGIPNQWKKWLELQQKYSTMRIEACREFSCEGESLSETQIEEAIIELENIEKQSRVIASICAEDYDYIPDTSLRFLDTYLVGNELYSHFDFWENKGLIFPNSKKSYEHFLAEHIDSRYYQIVKEYYNKLIRDKFKYTETTKEWLINEIEKYKY